MFEKVVLLIVFIIMITDCNSNTAENDGTGVACENSFKAVPRQHEIGPY